MTTHEDALRPPADPSHPRRRTVVKAAAVSAVLAGTLVPAARAASPLFLHGVASGDPLPDGVLLWTRVTPAPDATPGSGRGAAGEVGWEVAEDAAFAHVVAHGTVRTGPEQDHTVKADVRGLRPATTYHYRFTREGAHSPAGRTRTAPAAGARVDGARFGVVSCANWEAGYYAAYRHLAARADLDAVLHLGDYVYEYASGAYPTQPVRLHSPRNETLTLADYRLRHATTKTDADVQAVHARHPFVAIWDDHEFANDAWSGGAENHTPGAEGDWAARVAAAKQAYFEWMPVRPSTAGTVYRRVGWGGLAELHMLDLRSFRSEQAKTGSGAVDDPERSITGRAQLDWLKAGLSASAAQWQLIGTSVMISPLAFGALPAELLGPLRDLLGIPAGGLAINPDQWDGYTDDRRELLAHLRAENIRDAVFLTGDIHSAWANDVPVNAATYPLSASAATEFVVTSVTSDNIDDILGVPPQSVSPVAVAALRAANRHVHWADLDSHGYGVLDVTAARAQMDYYVLSDREDPAATSSWARSYATRAGARRLERVAAPVA
ncbi:alkaline phosphatase D family protein [Streptomyces evansiae]|uniref:alkaline phosphatase D family protein n=1 Tax=Streptomyces evansiae TaxID=3075535 RepID=UPI00081E63C3|nr:alkaline phosphatase D [Streptomyces sp. SolWspMP-sol7th]